jgi:hypothetical protein
MPGKYVTPGAPKSMTFAPSPLSICYLLLIVRLPDDLSYQAFVLTVHLALSGALADRMPPDAGVSLRVSNGDDGGQCAACGGWQHVRAKRAAPVESRSSLTPRPARSEQGERQPAAVSGTHQGPGTLTLGRRAAHS